MNRQTDRQTCRKGTERAASRGVGDGRSTPVQGQTRLPSLPLALIGRSPLPFPSPASFVLLITLRLSTWPSPPFFSPFASLSVFFVFSFFPSAFHSSLSTAHSKSLNPICDFPHFSSSYPLLLPSLLLLPPPFPLDIPFHRLPFCYSLQSSLASHWVAINNGCLFAALD